MNYTTIISVPELAACMGDRECIVFDCRHDLVDTGLGRRAYAHTHIPAARFLHLDEDLSGPKTGANGRHPLPDPARLCARLSALGMNNSQQVIAYDASGGYYAARLWWLLRWLGHNRAAVLDGGWDAWLQAGNGVEARTPAATPGNFSGTPLDHTVDARTILMQIEQPALHLVDARSADRFRGENETLDPVGGHIPGALNRFFKNNLRADGCFKHAAELRQDFSALLGEFPPSKVVHQCGSGVTACHNLLAMEIGGLPGSRLYPGSWSEWCSDPRRPVAR